MRTLLLFTILLAGCAVRLDSQRGQVDFVELANSQPPEVQVQTFKALAATIPPLTAAGVLTDAGWDCIEFGDTRDWYCWTAPDTGSAVLYYEVELTFRTAQDSFRFWLDPATCVSETCRVRGVDELERRGPWSLPGSCSATAP